MASTLAALSCSQRPVDPQVWLASVLACIAGHAAHRLDELALWNWKPQTAVAA
jgi:hypothetical protein